MISKSELKFIRSLKIKKYRLAAGCFLIEGEKNVLELIDSDFKIKRIVGTEAFLSDNLVAQRHAQTSPCTEKVLSSISSLSSNDRVVAVAEMKEHTIQTMNPDLFTLALDGISDPGNLGTIIRTLDWFGFNQIICSEDSVDFYNPKVVSASMGSFSRVMMVQANLTEYLKNCSGEIVGAEMKGEPIERLVKSKEPSVLVMGSESHGISSPIQKLLDYSVTIPKVGLAESLNVGIATGIICHSLASKGS